jgi:hypothetical protein
VGFIGDVAMLIFLYLFPDGCFVPRWSRWLALLWFAYQVPAYFLPQSAADLSGTWLGQLIFSCLIASGVAAQVYRYLRVASPVQRQQTKWVVFGITVGIALDLTLVAVATADILPWQFESGTPTYFVVLTVSFLALLLIPLSIGVAILRARLWDIDIIIRRTLVYGSLSGMLVLVYVSSVVLLQFVLRPLFGEQSPQLVTVASTLAIAALFSPLRRRIQTVIDQRFYRRKYNAAQILAAFSATMRDRTDLDALADDLREVVEQTMQPSYLSLWLRKPEPRAARLGTALQGTSRPRSQRGTTERGTRKDVNR